MTRAKLGDKHHAFYINVRALQNDKTNLKDHESTFKLNPKEPFTGSKTSYDPAYMPSLKVVSSAANASSLMKADNAFNEKELGFRSNQDSHDVTISASTMKLPSWLKPIWYRNLGVVLLMSTMGLFVTACNEETKTSNTPSIAEAVYDVVTIHPEFKNRERSYTLSGRVGAYTRADVRPQVDGIILNRLFDEGAQVKEGTPLYEIDPAPFKASLEYAQASYDRAVVQRQMAYKDYERFNSLYKRRSASEKERDDALLAYQLAQADEKLQKATLDKAQISLNYTTVRAPISGIIGSSKLTRGALVNANQSEPLATIIDLDKVYVDMEQSAQEWRKIREGMLNGTISLNERAYDVSLYFSDGTLYSKLGMLSLSEVIVDQDTGALTLRAIFDNPDHLLLPGMAVICKLNGGVAKNIMTLPAKAVLRDPKGNAYVYTVQGDRVVQTPVKLGQLFNDGWQITDGLDSTYEVVIGGVAGLHHGSKIRVVNQDGVNLLSQNGNQEKNPDAAVKAVSNPNTAASGLEQSSATAPSN